MSKFKVPLNRREPPVHDVVRASLPVVGLCDRHGRRLVKIFVAAQILSKNSSSWSSLNAAPTGDAHPRAAQIMLKALCHHKLFITEEWEIEASPTSEFLFLLRILHLYFVNKEIAGMIYKKWNKYKPT